MGAPLFPGRVCGRRMLGRRTPALACAAVLFTFACIVGAEEPDLFAEAQGLDNTAINDLSDGGTDQDFSAFDNGYDSNALVDKMAEDDNDEKDFDPDKMFAEMEELGESNARKNIKSRQDSEDGNAASEKLPSVRKGLKDRGQSRKSRRSES